MHAAPTPEEAKLVRDLTAELRSFKKAFDEDLDKTIPEFQGKREKLKGEIEKAKKALWEEVRDEYLKASERTAHGSKSPQAYVKDYIDSKGGHIPYWKDRLKQALTAFEALDMKILADCKRMEKDVESWKNFVKRMTAATRRYTTPPWPGLGQAFHEALEKYKAHCQMAVSTAHAFKVFDADKAYKQFLEQKLKHSLVYGLDLDDYFS